MKNIFEKEVSNQVIARIDKLTTSSQPHWGKMSVSQMLAHCNVTYEMLYTDKHPKPNAFMKFMLKLFVKNAVVSAKPYSKNGKTAPQFIIVEEKDFELEKTRLINYINQTQELGAKHFEGKESHSFGALTSQEWNNSFYKHLDHHLTQFGV
ncbi:DUF1569 domain-containing protein [Polaribacter sp.]|uniref:DUF1569 domain-containing protein n=1 Tax=Polaribacter sp. TaxID=1920175 RepID=UPI0035C832DD